MKFGVNTMVWTTRVGKAQEPLFARIRDWGFDGVELFLSPQEPVDIPAVRALLDRRPFDRTTCSMLPREANLISLDSPIRALGVDFLKKCVERTAELGAHLVCGPLYAALGAMTERRRTDEEWTFSFRIVNTSCGRIPI